MVSTVSTSETKLDVCVYRHTHTHTHKRWTMNNLPHPINPAAKDMTRARIPVITWPAVETTTG